MFFCFFVFFVVVVFLSLFFFSPSLRGFTEAPATPPPRLRRRREPVAIVSPRFPPFPHVPLFFRDVFGGFPALPVMCAAGDGGLAMLILLPGSGKYPSSPAQKENNKEPSVAAACGVRRSHQNTSKSHSVTLPLIHLPAHDSFFFFSKNQTSFFNPGKIKGCAVEHAPFQDFQGFQGKRGQRGDRGEGGERCCFLLLWRGSVNNNLGL